MLINIPFLQRPGNCAAPAKPDLVIPTEKHKTQRLKMNQSLPPVFSRNHAGLTAHNSQFNSCSLYKTQRVMSIGNAAFLKDNKPIPQCISCFGSRFDFYCSILFKRFNLHRKDCKIEYIISLLCQYQDMLQSKGKTLLRSIPRYHFAYRPSILLSCRKEGLKCLKTADYGYCYPVLF